MGTICLLVPKQRLLDEASLSLRDSETALNCLEEAMGHLILVTSRIGMPPGEWNVQSTRAQLALSRVMASLENFEPWQESSGQAEASCHLEWTKISAKAKERARRVAALAATLCAENMTPEARYRAEQEIASEISQLIANLRRVRTFVHELWLNTPTGLRDLR